MLRTNLRRAGPAAPQRVVLQALQAASAVLQGVGTGHPPPQEVHPFQELRHQFAFVYPFSDVLPLYNQKIYAKDTAKKRVKTDPTHASVKVKLNPKGKESMESESGMRVLTRYASFEEKTPGMRFLEFSPTRQLD
ncbi:hypothetical protein PF004_g17860 [Phytophthora fragariae]|uniref:Uncharacterized protein n=1 Tax=Phytophthora fragariae TaxID=53985 RepID=A0A6G0NE61_9STRA|nr:hypothetical protein PF004_g17860 [Phytophthora fragariae]